LIAARILKKEGGVMLYQENISKIRHFSSVLVEFGILTIKSPSILKQLFSLPYTQHTTLIVAVAPSVHPPP